MNDRPARYTYLDAEQASRVASYLHAQMERRGMNTQAALIDASQTSQPTVQPLMDGIAKRYWTDKLRAVSRAVGWTPPSIELIAAGREPVDADQPDPERIEVLEQQIRDLVARYDRIEDAMDEVRRLVSELVRRDEERR